MKKLILCGSLVLMSSVFMYAQQAPVKLETYEKCVPSGSKHLPPICRTYLRIISLVDSVTINNVVMNRGNCKVYVNYKENPETLGYGETANPRYACGNILEAEVGTNLGDWTFTFQ